MSKPLYSVLGDTPGRVIIKLLVFSLLVGIVMNLFGISPLDLLRLVCDFFIGLWNMGFSAFYKLFNVILIGAVIVVPIFFIMRFFNWNP